MSDVAEVASEEKQITEVFRSLHSMAKVIRDHHGISIPEAFQRFAGPGMLAEYRRIVKQMNRELEELGGEG